MKLKTITASTMQEALRIIKRDMGGDAVILSTRKIKGENGKQGLEITAAVEEKAGAPTARPPLLSASAPANNSASPNLVPFPVSSIEADGLTTRLQQHGIHGELIDTLTKALKGLKEADFSEADALEMILSKRIPFTAPADLITKGKAHVFLGPTGVGKTTFICKLAVQLKNSGSKIGLLSLDTHKIAGFEPLRVVAEMLGESAYLIESETDLQEAGKTLGARHYLFIDTPGLNPYNPEAIAAFQSHLNGLNLPTLNHLVVPASLSISEVNGLIPQFKTFNPSSILFTKVDETGSFGTMTQLALNSMFNVGLISSSPSPADAPVPLDAASLARVLLSAPKYADVKVA